MANKKSTKYALLASIMAVVFCCSMLIGTTFAWFTDSVTSSGNKIQAGTLKIDLLVRNENGGYDSVKDSSDPIFDYDLWEPGYTEVVNVKVANIGTLALQYRMEIVTEGLVEEMLDDEIMLSDVIDVYYAPKEVLLEDRKAFKAAVADEELKFIGNLTEVLFAGTMVKDTLLANDNAEGGEDEDFATIVLHMQESAGNEYQGLSVGTKFDINIKATQLAYEEDDFGPDYDVIELPSATLMVAEPELLDAYQLDAGCVFLSTEEWDNSWGYDYQTNSVNDGTPKYAFYYVDFVATVEKTDDLVLWGMYGEYGEQQFKATLEAGKETRVIPLADKALPNFNMGSISYKQLLTQVKTFACGVKEFDEGNSLTITLRMYETKLEGNSFVETGAYHDIAVYTYTLPATI